MITRISRCSKTSYGQKKVNIEAEIAIFKRNQLVEETTLLEEIQKNNTRE